MTVPRRIYNVAVSCPANTPSMAPVSQSLYWGDNWVHEVSIMVPPGHNGLTGFCLIFNGVALVPWDSKPNYLIVSNDTITVPIDTEIDRQLSARVYNTDTTSHTFYLRFTYTPMSLINRADIPTTVVPIL